MIPEDKFPIDQPRPRIDSFEIIEPGGPDLTDEEKTWPVADLRPRSATFGVIESEAHDGATEITIRVRCDSSATPAEVNALVKQLRSAVESVQANVASRFPVEIVSFSPTGN